MGVSIGGSNDGGSIGGATSIGGSTGGGSIGMSIGGSTGGGSNGGGSIGGATSIGGSTGGGSNGGPPSHRRLDRRRLYRHVHRRLGHSTETAERDEQRSSPLSRRGRRSTSPSS
jgi:hypothetical protein